MTVIFKEKLLTIAIPTWNRASTLEKALDLLFSQAKDYSGLLEIVISDNGSTDTTQSTITTMVQKYQSLDFILNRNEYNQGFYGNFKKCRELSTGKYIWLLSDDDHITNPNLIQNIIEIIQNTECDSIYLDCSNGNKQMVKMSTIDLLYKYNCLLTLISCVVFKNSKQKDFYIHEHYPNNAFLGLLYFFSSVNLNFGVSYVLIDPHFEKSIAEPKGYNWFDVFINQQMIAVNYLVKLGLKQDFIHKYKNSTLKYHIKKNYFAFRINNKLKGDYIYTSLKDINWALYKRFRYNLYFWLTIFPLMLCPKIILQSINAIRKTIKNNPINY